MRLNSANRAFVAIVVVAAATFGVFAGTACWVFSMLVYQLTTQGLSSLWEASTLAALVLVALLVASNVLAIRSIRSQVANTRRLERWVKARIALMTPLLAGAADEAGLAGRVVLVDSDTAFSFAYGIGRPKVAVSRGLVESVSSQELAAVLHHERYHVVNYDPLKVVLARSFPDALFFLPTLAELRGRYVAGRELAADRRALRTAGPSTLAGVLYKVIAGPPGVELGAAAAIGGDEALEARVIQLESGSEPPPDRLSTPRLLASVGGAGVLGWSAVASFVAFAPVMARLCTGR